MNKFLESIEKLPARESFKLLQKRFKQNYEFFKTHLPHLANLLKQNTKEYHLYYDDRGYNVATNDGKLLYDVKNHKSTLIDTSKLLAKDAVLNPSFKKMFNQQGLVRYNEDLIPLTTKYVNSAIDEIIKDKDFNNKTLFFGEDFLPPITLLGIMAGLQVEYLKANYEYIHKLFIFEPVVDFFIISNYFIDYKDCFNRFNDRFYLVVGGFLDSAVVKNFFASNQITSNYVRFEQSLYEDKRISDAKALLHNLQRQNTRGWGSVDDEMIGFNNRLINTKNPKNPTFAYLSKEIDINFPICVVGGGPSLENLLSFIKKNQQKMIIFSSGTALKPLMNYGIIPDFQIEIERRVFLYDVLKDAGFNQKTTLLMADIAHPKTPKIAQKTLFFVRDSTASTMLNNPSKVINFANPVVGNAAFSIALELSSQILMCGLDAGFKKDGKIHIKNSYYDNTEDKSKEMIPARGNLSNNIYTNSLFSSSRLMFEQAIANKKDKNILNLSDGVYIKGAKPTRVNEVKFKNIDKQKALKKLESAFAKKGFFKSFDIDYNDEIKTYIDEFFTLLLKHKVHSTKELFRAIDNAFYATLLQLKHKPVSAILLGGTFWHILNSLIIGLLHIQKEDKDEVFHRAVLSVKEKIDVHEIFNN